MDRSLSSPTPSRASASSGNRGDIKISRGTARTWAERWPVRPCSRASDRRLSPQPIIAPGWVDEGRVDELGLARGWGLVELKRWGRCPCSGGALALPRRIPDLKMPQDTLDHIVLPRRGDRRDDRHGLATATAETRILQPDFAYQPRPVAPALAQELIALFFLRRDRRPRVIAAPV